MSGHILYYFLMHLGIDKLYGSTPDLLMQKLNLLTENIDRYEWQLERVFTRITEIRTLMHSWNQSMDHWNQ